MNAVGANFTISLTALLFKIGCSRAYMETIGRESLSLIILYSDYFQEIKCLLRQSVFGLVENVIVIIKKY